jgi:hypothetical protein
VRSWNPSHRKWSQHTFLVVTRSFHSSRATLAKELLRDEHIQKLFGQYLKSYTHGDIAKLWAKRYEQMNRADLSPKEWKKLMSEPIFETSTFSESQKLFFLVFLIILVFWCGFYMEGIITAPLVTADEESPPSTTQQQQQKPSKRSYRIFSILSSIDAAIRTHTTHNTQLTTQNTQHTFPFEFSRTFLSEITFMIS